MTSLRDADPAGVGGIGGTANTGATGRAAVRKLRGFVHFAFFAPLARVQSRKRYAVEGWSFVTLALIDAARLWAFCRFAGVRRSSFFVPHSNHHVTVPRAFGSCAVRVVAEDVVSLAFGTAATAVPPPTDANSNSASSAPHSFLTAPSLVHCGADSRRAEKDQ